MRVLVDLGVWGPTATVVTAQDPAPPPGKGPEFGKASPVGLVVILVLLLATVLLVRSMSKHLRRIPASFDEPRPDEHAPGEHPSDEPVDAPVPDEPVARRTGGDDAPAR